MLQTDTAHACVYFYVAADRLRSVLNECFCVFCGNYALYDVVHRYLVGVLRGSVAENEYLSLGSKFPYGNCFVKV